MRFVNLCRVNQHLWKMISRKVYLNYNVVMKSNNVQILGIVQSQIFYLRKIRFVEIRWEANLSKDINKEYNYVFYILQNNFYLISSNIFKKIYRFSKIFKYMCDVSLGFTTTVRCSATGFFVKFLLQRKCAHFWL